MESKTLKKLNLNKSVIAKLTEDEQSSIKGGFTSSGSCTGFLCCNGPTPTNDSTCFPDSSPQRCVQQAS